MPNCAICTGCYHHDDCIHRDSICFSEGVGKILVNEQAALPSTLWLSLITENHCLESLLCTVSLQKRLRPFSCLGFPSCSVG